MGGKFDVMNIKYLAKKHNRWAEENQRNIEAYKNVRYQWTMYDEKSTGKSGSGKRITLSSQIWYAFCTDCGMSHAEKKNYWTLQSVNLEGPYAYYYVILPL